LIKRERISASFVEKFVLKLEFRHANGTAAPVYGAKSGLPTTGYTLVADGQVKSQFNTHDRALKADRDLKGRFPKLQVKIYDAEKKHSEKIEITAA
jgi:hypothetical protein